jgi:predicted ArsR family transcriptional regulator
MDLPADSEVLAQTTRARLFAELVRNGTALGTEELAGRLELHPNGVRRHLGRLHEAGLVERHRSRGERPSAYGDLSRWLARAIPADPTRVGEVERVGWEVGREIAPESPTDPVEDFRAVVAALGFAPTIEASADGGFSCHLENCPYRDSVRENQEVVCGMHRGITAGLLAELDPSAKMKRFEPQDPDRAGCLVEVVKRSSEVAR